MSGAGRADDRRDPLAAARRAGAEDRAEDPYRRRRARQAARRRRQDQERFDPAPPTDEDWVVEVEGTDAVQRITAPAPVGDTLGAFVRRRGWAERLKAADAARSWQEIVGRDLAERCEPVRLAGGCLVVRAESQVWATQLRYLVPQLVANAGAVLGADAVREVRIVVGPLEGPDT